MVDIGAGTEGLPAEVQSIPGPRVQRQVLLRPTWDAAGPSGGVPGWAAGHGGSAHNTQMALLLEQQHVACSTHAPARVPAQGVKTLECHTQKPRGPARLPAQQAASRWCTRAAGGMQSKLGSTCGTAASPSGPASARGTWSCTVRWVCGGGVQRAFCHAPRAPNGTKAAGPACHMGPRTLQHAPVACALKTGCCQRRRAGHVTCCLAPLPGRCSTCTTATTSMWRSCWAARGPSGGASTSSGTMARRSRSSTRCSPQGCSSTWGRHRARPHGQARVLKAAPTD